MLNLLLFPVLRKLCNRLVLAKITLDYKGKQIKFSRNVDNRPRKQLIQYSGFQEVFIFQRSKTNIKNQRAFDQSPITYPCISPAFMHTVCISYKSQNGGNELLGEGLLLERFSSINNSI